MSTDMTLPDGSTSVAPVEISVQEFIVDIEAMSHEVITKQRLAEYLLGHSIRKADLEPYKHWHPEKHTRNKIFRNDVIEAMLICWNIGNRTPAHTHNGQLGWMVMIEGQLLVENFRHVR